WGTLGGLALWTHLMSAAPVAASAVHLAWKAQARRLLVIAALPLVLASAPLWLNLAREPQAAQAVSTARGRSTLAHAAEVAAALHRPLGGLVGTHVPLVADDPDHVVRLPRIAALALVLLYAVGVACAAASSGEGHGARLLLASAALSLLAFALALRS